MTNQEALEILLGLVVLTKTLTGKERCALQIAIDLLHTETKKHAL
jgi:hypothetical protein